MYTGRRYRKQLVCESFGAEAETIRDGGEMASPLYQIQSQVNPVFCCEVCLIATRTISLRHTPCRPWRLRVYVDLQKLGWSTWTFILMVSV